VLKENKQRTGMNRHEGNEGEEENASKNKLS
jgi:hypothetical protein